MLSRRRFLTAAASPVLLAGGRTQGGVARPVGVKELRITEVHTVEVRGVLGKGFFDRMGVLHQCAVQALDPFD